MTQHCTHLEKIFYKSEAIYRPIYYMQDSLDQVSNWCDNNCMVINLIKAKSMTITTTVPDRNTNTFNVQSHSTQADKVKTGQVLEHSLLWLMHDHKCCWDSHIDNVMQNSFKTSLPSVQTKVHH